MLKKINIFKMLSMVLVFCTLLTNFQVFASYDTQIENITKTTGDEFLNVLEVDNIPTGLIDDADIDIQNVVAIDIADAGSLESFTTINNDGSKTLYKYETPIKYVDNETGEIEFIDNTLVEMSFFEKVFSSYAFKNASNDLKISLANKAQKGVLLNYNDFTFTIEPLTQTESIGEHKEYVFLGQTEKVIEYADAFGEGYHLQYNAVSSGLKENILIENYNGINIFQYKIKSPGLIPNKVEGENIEFLDEKTGELVFNISQTYVRDSYISQDDSIDNAKHISFDNYYTLEEVGNDEYILTSIVDKEFLESKTTVYPVLIDPTLTVNRGNILSASVFSGTSSRIINNYSTIGYLSGYGQGRAYIKTNTLQNHMYINPDKITSAYYHAKEISGNAHSATVQVWDTKFTTATTSVTYSQCLNNLDGSSPKYTKTISSSSTYYNIPITSLVKQWLKYELKDGGYTQNYGFVLALANGLSVKYKQFGSHLNSSYPPSIKINYSEDSSLSNGAYYIKNASSGKALDVANGASSSGANVQQYVFNRSRAQQWWIKKISTGIYEIIPAVNSSLRVDVTGGSNVDNQNIQLYASNSTPAQRWRIIKNADNTYRIISTLGNFHGVEVKGSSNSNGANVQLFSYYGNENQRWSFELIKPSIKSRSTWGAGDFTGKGDDTGDIIINGTVISNPTKAQLSTFYNMIVIHHTTRPANEAITSLQKSQKKEYADIGYHYVINANGVIYEGRPITKNGAHVGGQNSHKIGIALMGHLDPSFDINASSSRPTEKQIVSLQRLVAWLDYMYGIDSVKKHKDLNPNTICPGQYAEEDLASKYIFR